MLYYVKGTEGTKNASSFKKCSTAVKVLHSSLPVQNLPDSLDFSTEQAMGTSDRAAIQIATDKRKTKDCDNHIGKQSPNRDEKKDSINELLRTTAELTGRRHTLFCI